MARRRRGRPIDGWINLDKPLGLTSTQALGRLKSIVQPQKAGHAGTLDPMADGVLPVALGQATKTVGYMQDREKRYSFTIRWGIRTDTDDAEGEAIATSPHRPEAEALHAALPAFLGTISQIPPRVSALKIDGERAYDLARDGVAFEHEAREVDVFELSVLDIPDPDHATLALRCGKGFYVRALARDLARVLGTEGHVAKLTREAVGPFTRAGAVTLEALEAAEDSLDFLLPVDAVLDDIPAVRLTEMEAFRLRQGQPVGFLKRQDRERLASLREGCGADGIVRATEGTRLVALARLEGAEIRPVRIFNPA